MDEHKEKKKSEIFSFFLQKVTGIYKLQSFSFYQNKKGNFLGTNKNKLTFDISLSQRLICPV